jgi:hydroxyethylthiazole kinase-like uncharacterized protein yjeF
VRTISGQPILTVSEMRAAEETAVQAGATLMDLMRAAGEAVGEQTRRMASGAPVLILCGPGNNGGDGYIAAAALAKAGHSVRVAASAEPRTDLAKAAYATWNREVEALGDADPAPIVVDALFGIGPTRAVPPEIDAALRRLLPAAKFRIAVDVPSGVGADDASVPDYLSGAASFDLTLAVGALKPAHVLQPGGSACGEVRIVDIGLPPIASTTLVIAPALWGSPKPTDHKYTRGMVAIVAGDLEGAARLAATAALRAGAGYAAIFGRSGAGGADAVVHRGLSPEALRDPRIGAIVIGPGLGRDAAARQWLQRVIADDAAALVIDGDALHLLELHSLRGRKNPVVLTPHAGEFSALFGDGGGSQIDRTRDAARRSGCIVVFKGATTVISDAQTAIVSPNGSGWLSTAGTGDVLAGAIAAAVAGRKDADTLQSAADGVWLHAQAARFAGTAFIADDLANALSTARGRT